MGSLVKKLKEIQIIAALISFFAVIIAALITGVCAILGQPIINISVGQTPIAVITPSATSTYTPTVTASPTAMPEFLTILGNLDPDVSVTRYNCPMPAIYRIKIESGSYFPNSTGWRTVLLIFPDKNVEWSTEYVIDPQPDKAVWIGDFGANIEGTPDGASQSEMENLNTGNWYTDVFCQNSLLIVPMDIRGQYRDNQGAVSISIQRK